MSVRGVEQVSSSSLAIGTTTPPPPVLAATYPHQQLAPRQPPLLPAVTAAARSPTLRRGLTIKTLHGFPIPM